MKLVVLEPLGIPNDVLEEKIVKSFNDLDEFTKFQIFIAIFPLWKMIKYK